MPYHVELQRGRRRARAFNLAEGELRRTVIDPWTRGNEVTLGDHVFEPRDASLRILEGPALPQADLAFGQGWNRAERTATDVTRDMLRGEATTAIAILAPSGEAWAPAAELVERLGLRSADWAVLRRALVAWLAGTDGVAQLDAGAVLVVCADDPPDWWLLDAGLALGALGTRALLVKFAGGPAPAPLRDMEVLRVPAGPNGDLGALVSRLRHAGYELDDV